MLALYILQQGYAAELNSGETNPQIFSLTSIPKCKTAPGSANKNCISILYTPKDTFTDDVMRTLIQRNSDRNGFKFELSETQLQSSSATLEKSYDIVSCQDTEFIYDFVSKNPNTTQFAISFDTKTDGNLTNYRYQIWYNYTVTNKFLSNNGGSDVYDGVLPIARAVDEAILSNIGDASVAKLDTKLRLWPEIPPTTIPDTVITQLGPTFFFCAIMMIFINVLNLMVSEKELKLKSHMEMIGLMKSVYWISWSLSNSFIVICTSGMICLFGLAFGFSAFSKTNFMVLWITFALFGFSMVTMAFFITSFCNQTRTAVLIGIFVFVIGLLFQTFVFSNALFGYVWWDQFTSPAGWATLMFLPFFNFGKMFLDISSATVGKFDSTTETYTPGPGFNWSSIYTPLPEYLLPSFSSAGIRKPNVPSPIASWYLMLMNIGIFLFLAIYLDQVAPNEVGQRKGFFFFFSREYWGFPKKDEKIEIDKQILEEDQVEEPDVQEERKRAYQDVSDEIPMKIIDLTKVYTLSVFNNSNQKKAVNRLCLCLREGELLAFLGQNGAGKSSTMNMLSGLVSPTSGEAIMYGKYLTRDMTEISRIMGCCPQHDVLFPDLTAREHVELYSGLKGINSSEISDLMEERLKAVRLYSVAGEASRTFSGGMKRRLSLILSTIGDPKILYLDEPTTGMDPVNRRHVWSFIEDFKKNRVVILTSHSMEEAEVLGDRIGIMVYGKLRALANPIKLRGRFGSGFRISATCDANDVESLKLKIQSMIPSAVLEDDSAGAVLYKIPLDSSEMIPELADWLEENPDSIVTGWGLSQTTLEEVFLKVVRKYQPLITDPALQAVSESMSRKSSTSIQKKTD